MQYPHDQPFLDLQERVNSFEQWPQSDVVPADSLASAGFVYEGHHDSVKCFSCGGKIRNWEHGDDPWKMHAQSFPWCSFVTSEKGSEFVQEHGGFYSDRDGPADQDGNGNEAVDPLMACKICKVKNMNTVVMPCYHIASCDSCAEDITHCVVCQSPVIDRLLIA